MKLTIIAASGGIGRQLLQQAMTAGHQVTAVVRDPTRLAVRVRVVQADLATPIPAIIESAVRGADAVLSPLGPRSAAEIGIASHGTRAIVQGMQAAGVRRIVAVSAAPVGTVPSPGRPHPPKFDPGDGFLMRHLIGPILKAALRRHYADLALMEEVLRNSGLDWTVVRPPRLTKRLGNGRYRTAFGRNLRGGVLISRANVARLMLSILGQPEAIRQTIAIAA